jgi:hypothetical protein
VSIRDGALSGRCVVREGGHAKAVRDKIVIQELGEELMLFDARSIAELAEAPGPRRG